MRAAGPFEVQVQPEAGARDGRMALKKQYRGALEALADGLMLTGGDPQKGMAGYVAMETVTGALEGRQGTFQLMHWGTMGGGNLALRVEVVPGSGTGALAGLSGALKIERGATGEHTYTLDYMLPEG
jgi:hypothetical protein